VGVSESDESSVKEILEWVVNGNLVCDESDIGRRQRRKVGGVVLIGRLLSLIHSVILTGRPWTR